MLKKAPFSNKYKSYDCIIIEAIAYLFAKFIFNGIKPKYFYISSMFMEICPQAFILYFWGAFKKNIFF